MGYVLGFIFVTMFVEFIIWFLSYNDSFGENFLISLLLSMILNILIFVAVEGSKPKEIDPLEQKIAEMEAFVKANPPKKHKKVVKKKVKVVEKKVETKSVDKALEEMKAIEQVIPSNQAYLDYDRRNYKQKVTYDHSNRSGCIDDKCFSVKLFQHADGSFWACRKNYGTCYGYGEQ